MRYIKQAMLLLAVAVFSPSMAFADEVKESQADPEALEVINLIHAFYENDAEKFWEITSKFEHPQYGSLVEVQEMMAERKGEADLPLAIDGIPVMGKANTLREELGEITYRVENAGDDAGTVMYSFTAWVNRVIDFVYDGGRQEVTRKVVLKAYVQVRGGKFVTIYSNETEMEKSYKRLFAEKEKAEHKQKHAKHND
ncbi:hypothetical protein MNBD_NITROSPINAE01-1788 [hydrothermal vent metagenome]|uniref:Uncharacterized protein n=1 Tax=hydrothermal vent metagenome TaxID=652676 RepID=A0A3B1C5F3_9ZZZZ